MAEWTPSLVEARLAEAAWVLKRLPEPRRQGYFSTWPEDATCHADVRHLMNGERAILFATDPPYSSITTARTTRPGTRIGARATA